MVTVWLAATTAADEFTTSDVVARDDDAVTEVVLERDDASS
jgi:hypothetical protein